MKHSLILLYLISFIFILMPVNNAHGQVLPWYFEDYYAAGYCPTLDDPNNANAAQIHARIKSYISDQEQHFRALGFNKDQVTFNYLVSYEDDKVLSLLMIAKNKDAYRTGGHSTIHGLTFNKKTGNLLPLNYFLILKSSDLESLSHNSYFGVTIKSIMNRNAASLSYTKIAHDTLTHLSNDYILLGDGSIGLIYKNFDPNNANAYLYRSIILDAGQVKYYNLFNRSR